MAKLVPVIRDAAGDARKTMAPVTSSMRPMRPSGIRLMTQLRNSGSAKKEAVMGVSRNVGAMAFTRMFSGASSTAMALVKPSIACLAMQYAVRRSAYCMAKHAIEGLTKAMAVELAPENIRVNAIAPTFLETPMTASFFADPEFRNWVISRIPLGRIGRMDEVTGAIVFLASPAASLITGTSLAIDGGWTAR